MAAPDRVHYLENNKKRFGELSIRGNESTLRYGKVGCKGRTTAPKAHPSPARCRQWAVIQVNAKGFEEYWDPTEEDPDHPLLLRRVTSMHAESLGLSRQPTVRLSEGDVNKQTVPAQTKRQHSQARQQASVKYDWRRPHKKQATIRRIGEKVHATWRKPPRKQSTVRALGRQISLQQKLGQRSVEVEKKGTKMKTMEGVKQMTQLARRVPVTRKKHTKHETMKKSLTKQATLNI